VKPDAAQDGRRDADIDCHGEVLGSESDGSFNLCGDLSARPALVSFSPRFSNRGGIPLSSLLSLL